ncbi:hypothetical protein INR49_031306 [Caranx melampygus]|nr:hypothetical protein INR49_031306 [Caranx melampygus]
MMRRRRHGPSEALEPEGHSVCVSNEEEMTEAEVRQECDQTVNTVLSSSRSRRGAFCVTF